MRQAAVAVVTGLPALVLALVVVMWAVIAVAGLGVVAGCAVLARTLVSVGPALRSRPS